MWVDVELILVPYRPLKIEKGMIFIKYNTTNFDSLYEVFELDNGIPDPIPYMDKYGCPVELSLFEHFPHNPDFKYKLAEHTEIAWVDEGEDSEDMHEITATDINKILANKRVCQLQINDKFYEKDNIPIPVYDEEKVIIRLIEEE